MKKILTLTLIIICMAGYIFSQDNQSKKVKLNESDIVYILPGGHIFHISSCHLLGPNRTLITVRDAFKKGLEPCPFCVPMKKVVLPKKEAPMEVVGEADISEPTEEQIQAADSQAGFKGATWGMNQEQIKALEDGEFIKKQKGEGGLNILAYKGEAGGFSCIAAYYFAENQLVEGRYIFAEKHSNRNLYMDDFSEIKSNLVEKYGDPTRDNVIWRNDLYKDDYSEWGMAIAVGHLGFESIWELSKTKIHLKLHGDNYDISLALDYKSNIKEHKELVKKVAKKSKKGIW